MMFDTEYFISLVHARPAIYDKHCKQYTDKNVKNAAWAEICEQMYDGWNYLPEAEKNIRCNGLMVKWKSLRDNFVKEMRINQTRSGSKNSRKKRKYIYFENLSFLLTNYQNCSILPDSSEGGNDSLDESNKESNEEPCVILREIKTEENTVEDLNIFCHPFDSDINECQTRPELTVEETLFIEAPPRPVPLSLPSIAPKFNFRKLSTNPIPIEQINNTSMNNVPSQVDQNMEDEFEIFGKHVANQLRRLPLSRALLCQQEIQSTLTRERIAALNDQ